MSDYISRQAAIEAIENTPVKSIDAEKGLLILSGLEKACDIIEAMPAADVVPVVRCEECKHHSFDAGYGNYWCNLTSGVRKVKRFDFCSYGERKEA